MYRDEAELLSDHLIKSSEVKRKMGLRNRKKNGSSDNSFFLPWKTEMQTACI